MASSVGDSSQKEYIIGTKPNDQVRVKIEKQESEPVRIGNLSVGPKTKYVTTAYPKEQAERITEALKKEGIEPSSQTTEKGVTLTFTTNQIGMPDYRHVHRFKDIQDIVGPTKDASGIVSKDMNEMLEKIHNLRTAEADKKQEAERAKKAEEAKAAGKPPPRIRRPP